MRPYAAGVADVAGAGWRTFGERVVYGNRWVRVDLVEVEAPNGERWEHHVVNLDRVAIALVVNERDEALMLWRYRFAIDRWGYELLGGLVEEGEEPAETARREIVEESGWRPAGEPEHLGTFEPMPGMVRAPVDLFLFRGAEKVGEPTDLEEAGRLDWVPLSRVPELMRRGELMGAGTIIPLLWVLVSRAARQDQAT